MNLFTDTMETQFWAGNEFLYFENKDIRAAANNVSRLDSNTPYLWKPLVYKRSAYFPIPLRKISMVIFCAKYKYC
jgi:hypothetical protein